MQLRGKGNRFSLVVYGDLCSGTQPLPSDPKNDNCYNCRSVILTATAAAMLYVCCWLCICSYWNLATVFLLLTVTKYPQLGKDSPWAATSVRLHCMCTSKCLKWLISPTEIGGAVMQSSLLSPLVNVIFYWTNNQQHVWIIQKVEFFLGGTRVISKLNALHSKKMKYGPTLFFGVRHSWKVV